VLPRYPANTALLSLLPLAVRMAGPKEALLHGIVHRNYGCTHLIIDRDHAELFQKYSRRIGIEMVPFKTMVYVKSRDRYEVKEEVGEGEQTAILARLSEGLPIPSWFTFPEVAMELQKRYLPKAKQGFTIFFTGLSGAGKTTLARMLLYKLEELTERPVTLLDGDVIRKNLSSELGFSKAHRDLNIRRIGFVAMEITKNRGIVICAPIAPYDAVRKEVRSLICQVGGFVLVHVCTPLEVCEKRDRKCMYRKARAGIIQNFTGISDPYEAPDDAELSIDTTAGEPAEAVQRILGYLTSQGYLNKPV
jgi:sulfate adenylyltransferase